MFDKPCPYRKIYCKPDPTSAAPKTHYYTFVTESPRAQYIVLIEEYEGDIFVVKFFLKNHTRSPNKYHLLSNLNTPSRVIGTVLYIMLSVLKQIPTASFGFMGAPVLKGKQKEVAKETKRLRVYKQMIANTVGTKTFSFWQDERSSIYFMKNKKKDGIEPSIKKLAAILYDNYENLEINLIPLPVLNAQTG